MVKYLLETCFKSRSSGYY